MKTEQFLPAEIIEVPTKTEISKIVNEFISSENLRAYEKYVWLKGLEKFVKEAITKLQPDAIESFLEAHSGSSNEYVFGANVKITNERKTETYKRYLFSDEVTKIENEIEAQKNELKLLNDKLKLRQTLEINQGIATEEDLFQEETAPKWGITITLTK